MAKFDAVHRKELWDDLAYELYAIAEYRERLYLHRDDQHTILEHTLGAVSSSGDPVWTSPSAAKARRSDRSVREALAVMRPHAFATAFKVHDLVVEWVLGPTPGKNPRWLFTAKHAALPHVAPNDRPVELQDPPRWQMFREVYVALTEPRNVVTHRKGLDIRADGSVGFNLAAPQVLALTDLEQGAYLRAMAILGDALAEVFRLDRARTLRLDAALALLSALPGVTPVRIPESEWTHLNVSVPPANILASAPLIARVDFDFIARVWKAYAARVPHKLVAGIVNVRPNGQTFVWQFTHDALLTGTVDLTLGFPQHDAFIVHD
jgi:hypothetical protein